jgi:hypothetical protein
MQIFRTIVVSLVAFTACAGRAPTPPPATAAATASSPHLLVAAAAPETATPPPAGRRSNGSARTIGWISIAVGGEAAVFAIATSVMMLNDKSVRDSGCDANKVCTSDGFSANSTLDALAWWNVAAYGVAAAGLGIGTVLLLTNPRDRESGAALVVSPNGTGANLAVRGAF